MPEVMTVLGLVPADSLGPTAVHEHVFIDLAGPKGDADARLADPVAARAEIEAFVAAGGRTLVDMTPIGLGRRPAELREVARLTGANIIAATGLYYGRFLPEWVAERTVEEIAAVFIAEARDGIDGSGVRPGVIGEIGTGRSEISPLEEKVFRAAARAHRATGLPIATHCTLGSLAEEQLALLEAAGVDPRRVIIGHQDLRPDIASHVRLAARGAFIAYDTAGKEQYQSDDTRARLVAEMFSRGYGSHVLVSCDITRQSYLRCNGGCGYAHLMTEFRDRLRGNGLSDVELHRLQVLNPAQAFALDTSAQ